MLRGDEALHELEALGDLLAGLLALGDAERFGQLLRRGGEIDAGEHEADGFRTHAGREGVAVLFLRFAIFGLAQQLLVQERGLARIDHEVILIIDDALELPGGHVHHEAEAAGHALEEPDVRDGHGQFDVAHALAAHARQRHLDAATVADHALVLDPFVLSARALPVLGRTENAFAEETAFFPA